jgi:hypothetical protein
MRIKNIEIRLDKIVKWHKDADEQLEECKNNSKESEKACYYKGLVDAYERVLALMENYTKMED